MDVVHPLKAWRDAKGLTQEAIGREVGILPSHVSQLEKGKKAVSMAVAARIERMTDGAITAGSLQDAMAGAAE